MAQLKDTIVTGDLSVTGTIYGDIPLNNLTDADDLKAIEALTGTSGILTKTAANTWSLASGATPASHAHGNITNAGAIGTTANLPVFTTTNGVLNTVTAATALTNLGAAASGHTHATTIATSTGTNQLTLAFNTKYALTAGGTSYIFTTPANPNTDTKVTQAAAITANGAYPILLGYDTNTTAVTNTVNKGALTYNPSTKALKTGLTTAANAIAVYTDTTGTLGTKATAAGAAYATAANGALTFGTLPVAQGGTGATSFTANSVVVSGSSTTAALTTRAITNITAKGGLGWTTAGGTNIPTLNTLAYWNGRYDTSNSNLEYCSLGAFGTMATASADDYIAKSIGTAAGDIIYWTGSGTPARLAKGSNGQVLTLANGVPSWATVSGSGGGVQTDNGNARIYYGTCSTAADQTAKVVDCSDYTTLQTGDTMIVKFTHTNSGTAGSLTLNVNGTGAKSIKKLYNYALNNLTNAAELHEDLISVFVYNGTYWILTNADYNSNTDTKVTQAAAITTSGNYPVLLGYSTATTAVTNTIKKTSTLVYNPSTQALIVGNALIAKHNVAINATVSTNSSKTISFYDSSGTFTDAKKIGSIESLVNTDGTSQLNFTAYDFQDPTLGSVALSIIKQKSGSNSSGYVKISYSKVQDFAVRNIAFGSSTPTSTDGENGDVFIKI